MNSKRMLSYNNLALGMTRNDLKCVDHQSFFTASC